MEQTVLDISRLYHVWRQSPELEVVFQPLVHIPSGKPFGYEALSRPLMRGEPVPVGQLLESATRLQQLSDFDRVAVPRILKAATHAAVPPHQKLFINFSPFTLLDAGFLLEALQDPDVSIRPEQIVIEISEREALPGMDLITLLAPYRERGMQIALDDFGAGYSGLTRVVDLDPDYAKIDLSLVREIDKNAVKYALVESTVQFAGRSGRLQVLAEGIETRAELATLFELGVSLGQGYLLGRPAPGLNYLPHGVSLDLLTRRIPDPADQLQAFLTTTHRLIDGIGFGEGLVSHVVHLTARLTGADVVGLWQLSGDGLTLEYGLPEIPDSIRTISFNPSIPSYQAATERRTVVCQTRKECAASPLARDLGMHSMLIVPVVDRLQTRSVLVVGYKRPLQIRPQEIQMTEGLARLVGLVRAAHPRPDDHTVGFGEPLFEAIAGLVASDNLESLLAKVMEAALSVSGGHLGYIGLMNTESLHAVTADRTTFDIPRVEIFDERTDVGRGPIGRALRDQQMVVIQDIAVDQTMDPWRQDMLADGIQAALAIPLLSRSGVLGLLKVYHSHKNGFEAGRIRRLEALASLATAVIEKWQEEHYATRLWVRDRSKEVIQLIRELAMDTSATEAVARIHHAIAKLFGGTASGLVPCQHGKPLVESQDGLPADLETVIRVAAERAVSTRWAHTSVDSVSGESLFVMPLLVGGDALGVIWVLYPSVQDRLHPDVSQLLTPHLATLSLAGGASLLLERLGH